jgi:branched-subunit amino acid aminotransferase/4-amino-4-deoxychorismate lyase
VSATARGWLERDGGWIPADSLPLTDRGVRYGMAVFETIGIRDGRALFLEEHNKQLSASAKALLGAEIHPTLPALDPDDRGVLRIYMTAGDGAPADPAQAPRIFALFEPVAGELPPQQTARLHPEAVFPFAHGAKTANYWMQCAAQAAARREGFDHALLFDHEGHLLSAAMGNIFFTLKDELCTPAPSLALRPGVMRAWVMGAESVREMEFPARRMEEIGEIFLTNSRLGVMPLQYGKIAPGPVGCALRDRCRREKLIP